MADEQPEYKKTLFNEHEAYTSEGSELGEEAHRLIDKLVKKWVDLGYQTRDIESIIGDQLEMACVHHRVWRSLKFRMAKKQNGKP
jgi:hypothetical protein